MLLIERFFKSMSSGACKKLFREILNNRRKPNKDHETTAYSKGKMSLAV